MIIISIHITNMTHTISAMDARKQFGDMLNRVMLRQDEFLIERNGKAMAAVVPLAEFEEMKALKKEAARQGLAKLLETLRSAPPSGLTDDEAMALANEAKHLSRAEA